MTFLCVNTYVMERKKCNCCGESKSISDFHLDRGKSRSNCKKCHNEQKRKNYHSNRQYYIEKFKEYDSSAEAKEKRREREKKRLLTDPIYKMERIYRGRLQKAISGWCRSKRTEEILGCSWEHLKQYIESKFQDGMTWENHGFHGWHVDHIIPLGNANTLEELEKLAHYTNLQPLWAIDNFKKGDSVITH
jgi:hypothetical protein